MALSRKHRIVRDKDFNRAFRLGKVVGGQQVLLKIIPNDLSILRVGVAVSAKKFPRAATRNKIKRSIFSEAQKLIGKFGAGCDVIVVALKEYTTEESAILGEFMRRALYKAQKN